MKTIIGTFVLVSSLALLSTTAYAAGGGRNACKQDVQTYCSDVQRGGGRIVKCLKEHEKDLSSQCATAMGKLEDRMQERKDNKSSGSDDSSSTN
ncbi:MAG TPA: cysteine rich repeat-containing protein [Rickettsiales bacterium]|nr:cysteine rich repeat-containing protein [Rickettsiales bacterium]